MLNNRWKMQIKDLFDCREILKREDFNQIMLSKGYGKNIIEIVYDKITNYLPSSIHTKNIYPEDNLINDYAIDDEDLADILNEIFVKFNLKFPRQKDQLIFYERFGDDFTVEKMICFISYFKDENRVENI